MTAAGYRVTAPSGWSVSRGEARLLGVPLGAWVPLFVLMQVICQAALLVDAIAPLRAMVRSVAYGVSLLMLFFLPGVRGKLKHPASLPVAIVIGIVMISYLHPGTTPLAGIAQVFMYAAIAGPIYWATRTGVNTEQLRTALMISWSFHFASSFVGVLQVLFPGRFQPTLSSYTSGMDSDYIASLMITTASGERMFRPMGLTEVPGGAAASGYYAVLFGLGFFLEARSRWARAAAVASMVFGFTCLYLAQVRFLLVMLGFCLAAVIALLAWRREVKRISTLLTTLALVILGSFAWAVTLGGDAVVSRLSSLTERSPEQVYYDNRGRFLEYTINDLLPAYPLGAGLGRWGMVNAYFADPNDIERGQLFGDRADARRGPIWVEIQWTGWLLDGGVPLVIAYTVALGVIFVTACRLALSRWNGELWIWAALVVALNLGGFAATFNFPFYLSQGGMELLVLNGALYSAAMQYRRATL